MIWHFRTLETRNKYLISRDRFRSGKDNASIVTSFDIEWYEFSNVTKMVIDKQRSSLLDATNKIIFATHHITPKERQLMSKHIPRHRIKDIDELCPKYNPMDIGHVVKPDVKDDSLFLDVGMDECGKPMDLCCGTMDLHNNKCMDLCNGINNMEMC